MRPVLPPLCRISLPTKHAVMRLEKDNKEEASHHTAAGVVGTTFAEMANIRRRRESMLTIHSLSRTARWAVAISFAVLCQTITSTAQTANSPAAYYTRGFAKYEKKDFDGAMAWSGRSRAIQAGLRETLRNVAR